MVFVVSAILDAANTKTKPQRKGLFRFIKNLHLTSGLIHAMQAIKKNYENGRPLSYDPVIKEFEMLTNTNSS